MKTLWKIIAISTLLLALVACGKKEDSTEQKTEQSAQSTKSAKVEEIKKKGKLVMGTSADFPPMEWIVYNGTQEEYVGVDIEIDKSIAKELGVELEVKNMAFEGLINSLKAGDLDIVLAGMVPTAERKEVVDFTSSYSTDGTQVILVRGEDTDKYHQLEDLKGKKIGAQMGTIQFQFADKEFPGQVTAMDNNNALILELKNKTLDCLFLSGDTAKQFQAAHPELKVVEDIGAPKQEGNAVAIKKGDGDLLNVCEKVVQQLKSSGKIDEWMKTYITMSVKNAQKVK